VTDLRITVRVPEPLVSAPALDGLLGFLIAEERGLVAGFGPMVSIDDLPLERSACGRVWLASFAQFEPELHEVRFTNRKFPMGEAQFLGASGMRKIDIGAGVNRSYRIPGRVTHVMRDEIVWYARGDRDGIVSLLERVTHLGKRRAAGRGRVTGWTVEPCAPWPGFPVVRDGKPLRALPPDWPGLESPKTAYVTLSPPYWENRRAELAAVP
jgi:CRISPR type IV-associated protein Csf3